MFGKKYKNFFNEYAITANTSNIKEAEHYYKSLCRLIRKKLQEEQYVSLPGICNLSVFERGPRRWKNIKTGQIETLSSRMCLRTKKDNNLWNFIRKEFN